MNNYDYFFNDENIWNSIKKVVINNGITSIGGGVFSGCSSLKEIIIPEGVTSIDEGVFHFCMNLTKITIPDSVSNIHTNAFYSFRRWEVIDVPGYSTSFLDQVHGCESLEKVIFTGKDLSIKIDMFYETILREKNQWQFTQKPAR